MQALALPAARAVVPRAAATTLVLRDATGGPPLGLPKRFDTVFFVARAPDGQVPRPDERETTTLEWIAPRSALEAHAAGAFQMEFATVATVRSLLPFAEGRVQQILEHAAALRQLHPVHPRLKVDADRCIVGVLLPGEPGYDALEGDGPSTGINDSR